MSTETRFTGLGLTLIAVVVATMLSAATAHAGALVFAGSLTDEGFSTDGNAPGPTIGVTQYCTVTLNAADGQGTTRIEETLLLPTGGDGPMVCIVPLPDGIDGDSLTLTVDGKAAQTEYLSAEDARKLYETLARATGRVQVLSLCDTPAALVRSFQGDRKAEVAIEYSNNIHDDNGLLTLTCPMPATSVTGKPVERLTLKATVHDARPLRGMFSPTHQTTIERSGLHDAEVRVSSTAWAGGVEFQLFYVADEDPLGVRVIAHRGEGDDEGYFLLIGNPTGSDDESRIIEKDVLFVLDTSGSMRGEKMEQARSAIEYCLKQLNAGDRFNIITFGTGVTSFRPELAGKSDAHLKAAGEFIDDVVATGRTNINDALARALMGEPDPKRPRIMIFLTDGTPTAGELVPDNIIKNIAEANSSRTRIFVLGVGYDVNAHLLDRLAEQTDGSSEYVLPEEEIDVKVAGLYDRLSNPVLTDVELAFGGLRPNSLYPARLPALFQGSQFIIAGRYRDGGEHEVSIGGMQAGEKITHTYAVHFPEKASAANDFVAPLWAARKIGFLLQEIRLHGEDKELVDEIVHLSRKFGILTEYTEFIAVDSADMSVKELREEVHNRMQDAHRNEAGQWAFNQAGNDLALQQRESIAAEDNTYVDRSGKRRQVDNIRQIGRRTFYRKDDGWVEAEEAGDRKARDVKLFSEEYYELVRTDADFARAQELGSGITINVGGERITVKE